MPNRRNLTEREIVQRRDVDLSNIQLAPNRAGGADSPAVDGGSFGNTIGVPSNFRIISQEVVDFNGEYRVNIVVEFDGVAGATEYEARIEEVFEL